MKDFVKLIVMLVARFTLKIFWIFPVNKNKMLFCSFEGKQYSCNPKYLFIQIAAQFDNKYSYIWVLNNKNSEDYNRLLLDISEINRKLKDLISVKIVRFFSIRHFYHYLTSKYIISNLNIEPVIPKRKNQVYLATWHASGAYKNMDFSDSLKPTAYKVKARDFRAENIDFYVSGCGAFTNVYVQTWNTKKEKFISCGLPRNDLFFAGEDVLDTKKKEIKDRLKLSDDCSYILFAPTYRGLNNHNHKSFSFELDVNALIRACENRFGKKFKMLLKNHVDTASSDVLNAQNVIEVSWYSDMQELLLISDILLTDYSSSIWDFALLNKPSFLYTPDLQAYLKERGFYTPIEKWPFDYAASNDELVKLVEKFDEEKNKKKIREHFEFMESFESGTACNQIIKRLGL